MKQFLSDNKRNPWFWAFIGIAAILFFAMPIMSKDAGNSGDEDKFQIPQGRNILSYYQSDKQDTTCLSFENLKYYGSSFDYWTALYCDKFHVDEIAQVRHVANSLLGWCCILFVGLIAYRMGGKDDKDGWGAGVIAMILMFISPRFLGHSFNNPKDIPLAAGVIMSIYYILMFFRQASDQSRKMPKVSTMIMLALSIALAISIRIGGLIIVGYFGLWGLLWAIFRKSDKGYDWTGFFRTLGLAIAICIVGFFVGILRWPYAMQAPIANSMDSYKAMSQFAIGIRQIYEGTMMWSDALPWYYTPKFILTTIPIAVIFGWIFSLCLGWRKKGLELIEKVMILFCFLFPVVWIVITRANVYGGWRHSLFVYPPMVASAALGFSECLNKLKEMKQGRILSIAAAVVMAVMMVGPVRHICANHPYEYVYFNEFAGGNKKAFGQYEMDYYYHSMREATEWVVEHAEVSDMQLGEKTIIGTWLPEPTKYFIRHDTTRFKHNFIRWYQRGTADWDYLVFPITGIAPEYLKCDKVFPPKETVHTIEVDGVPIGLVLKRQDKNDYYGAEQRKAGNIDSAVYYYRKALAYNPYNEAVLMEMAEIYLQMRQPDSALLMCQRFMEIEPSNDNANYMAAYAYLVKGDVNQAVSTCESIKKHNFKFAGAYTLLLQIYMQQQNLYGAESEILQLIDIDQLDNQTMQTFVAIKRAQGMDERTAVRTLYSTIAKSLEKRGKKKEAEMYKGYVSQI